MLLVDVILSMKTFLIPKLSSSNTSVSIALSTSQVSTTSTSNIIIPSQSTESSSFMNTNQDFTNQLVPRSFDKFMLKNDVTTAELL